MTAWISILFSLLASLLVSSAVETASGLPNPSPLDWNSSDQSPRRLALEMAAGNADEGYQIHDGFWSGALAKDAPVHIEVYLFAGNDYRFSAANVDFYSQLRLKIFDSWGFPVGNQYSGDSSCSAAGISVIQSGRYFIQLVMSEGDKADTCMVYSYK